MANDAPITSANWFPAFTLLVGFVTASISEWLKDRRAAAREREGREASKQEQRLERRITFQRQTLLDLQEELLKLVRTSGEMNYEDNKAFRETGRWQKQLYEEDLNERASSANAQTLKLGVRVRDESVRKLLAEVRTEAISAKICRTPDDAERAILEMAATFDKLNERIGELLRKLDDDESRPDAAV